MIKFGDKVTERGSKHGIEATVLEVFDNDNLDHVFVRVEYLDGEETKQVTLPEFRFVKVQ